MDDKQALELRLACLERKLWAVLLRSAERRDLEMVREVLGLIEAVEKI